MTLVRAAVPVVVTRTAKTGARRIPVYSADMDAARVPRVFLLSPARSSGPRARALAYADSDLGRGLRGEGAPLGDVFAFLSSLYFRGKLTYATHFASDGLGAPGVLIITPGHGLCRPSTMVRAETLHAIGNIEVDADNPEFVAPLLRDAALLHASIPAECEVVLLGSVATAKYVEPLLSVFGQRLMFPREFVGRGDMSRGGLLLRATRERCELSYDSLQTSVRSGRRARRLSELTLDDPDDDASAGA